jgi:hypothetical protein
MILIEALQLLKIRFLFIFFVGLLCFFLRGFFYGYNKNAHSVYRNKVLFDKKKLTNKA